MDDKQDGIYDEHANRSAEDRWIRSHLAEGHHFPFLDCEHCETWIAHSDKCFCGKTWITYVGVGELGDGAYTLEICGIPDHTIGRG